MVKNSKFQASKTRHVIWTLEVGASLELDAWDLELKRVSLKPGIRNLNLAP
jgi:hypothetical protein